MIDPRTSPSLPDVFTLTWSCTGINLAEQENWLVVTEGSFSFHGPTCKEKCHRVMSKAQQLCECSPMLWVRTTVGSWCRWYVCINRTLTSATLPQCRISTGFVPKERFENGKKANLVSWKNLIPTVSWSRFLRRCLCFSTETAWNRPHKKTIHSAISQVYFFENETGTKFLFYLTVSDVVPRGKELGFHPVPLLTVCCRRSGGCDVRFRLHMASFWCSWDRSICHAVVRQTGWARVWGAAVEHGVHHVKRSVPQIQGVEQTVRQVIWVSVVRISHCERVIWSIVEIVRHIAPRPRVHNASSSVGSTLPCPGSTHILPSGHAQAILTYLQHKSRNCLKIHVRATLFLSSSVLTSSVCALCKSGARRDISRKFRKLSLRFLPSQKNIPRRKCCALPFQPVRPWK